MDNEQAFWESIEIMVEIIIHEYETSNYEPQVQLMCVRGLLLLMLNEHFADYMGQLVTEKVLTVMVEVLGDSLNEDRLEEHDLKEHPPAIQFMSILPKKLLHEFVMQLQNILTLNIIQNQA